MMPTLTTDREPTSYLPPAATLRELGRARSARPDLQQAVALVVDADENFRCIVTKLLAQVGYAVVAADNVDDACRLASEALPTLVVTDLRIGLHDARLIPIELRRIAAAESIPMVVSSAWDLPQDRTLAESVNAELFTTTPIDFRAIKALAATIIQ